MIDLFPSPEHRALLLSTLKLLGAKTVTVVFSGGGDSGAIDSVDVLNAQGQPIDISNQGLEWVDVRTNFDSTNSQWVNYIEPKTMELEEILKRLTESALEEQGLDWYNNDGGQGQLTIDFSTSPPSIELNVGINYTATEDHHFSYTEEPHEENT
jgi:hypothetical protein